MGRTILGLLMVVSMGGATAWAAPSDTDVVRERAQKLAKAGRKQEAAAALRGAADQAGAEGPALRFEAALMLQQSGQFQDAQSLHREVSTDPAADFGLRVRARYAAEGLYWVLELNSLAAPALDDLSRLRDEVSATSRRIAEVNGSTRTLADRLDTAEGQLVTTRKTLLPLVGARDPMIAQLDELLVECQTQNKNITAVRKSVGTARRTVASASKGMSRIGKAIEALAEVASTQSERARRGDGKLKTLTRFLADVTKRGAKAAQASGGEMGGIRRDLVAATTTLDRAEQRAEEAEQVLSAAEIVLQGAP